MTNETTTATTVSPTKYQAIAAARAVDEAQARYNLATEAWRVCDMSDPVACRPVSDEVLAASDALRLARSRAERLEVERRRIEEHEAARADKAAREVLAAKALYLVASEAWLACDVHSASIDTLCDAAHAARDDLRMARHEVEVIKVERRRIKE